MHPALHSWRDELSGTLVRMLAYLGAAAVLSMAATQFFQATPARQTAPAARDPWTTIRKPFPAFALSIPEAGDAPAHYTIRYNAEGGGRQDILSRGEPDGANPYLEVLIYRPGSEISQFPAAEAEMTEAPPRSAP